MGTESDQRIFSEAELRKLETPLVEQLVAAIDAGNHGRAKVLARQLERECTAMIHTFEDFVTALLSSIYQSAGDATLEASLRYAATTLMKPMHDNLAGVDFRELVEVFAGFFRAHTGQGLRIVEDDEKVTMILNPCGSGGRMVKEGYFSPPRDLLKVKEAQALTFGREDFPSYCTHCAVFHHIMPIEWAGKPFPPIEVGAGPGDPCKWHFYKNAAAIPACYYEQVGQQKRPAQAG